MPGGSSPCLLVLNAAEGRLQFILARSDKAEAGESRLVPLCAQSWNAPSQGAELLAPALRDALARLHLKPGDIGRIACVRGPGSFTGVRLALATAAGLARAVGALQAGIDYMPLLAENAYALAGAGIQAPCRVWALTHARRQLTHLQGFAVEGGLKPLSEILVAPPQEALDIILSSKSGGEERVDLALGSGLSRNRQAIENALAVQKRKDLVLLPADFDQPAFSSLLRAAEKAEYSHKDIEPLYVRPSDAEENLEHIAASLGLDPAEARKKLERLAAADPE